MKTKTNIYKLFEFLARQVHNKYQSLLRSQIEFLLLIVNN